MNITYQVNNKIFQNIRDLFFFFSFSSCRVPWHWGRMSRVYVCWLINFWLLLPWRLESHDTAHAHYFLAFSVMALYATLCISTLASYISARWFYHSSIWSTIPQIWATHLYRISCGGVINERKMRFLCFVFDFAVTRKHGKCSLIKGGMKEGKGDGSAGRSRRGVTKRTAQPRNCQLRIRLLH